MRIRFFETPPLKNRNINEILKFQNIKITDLRTRLQLLTTLAGKTSRGKN